MPPMTLPGPVPPQAMALRPEAAAAALKLANASLEALALKAGQVLDAKVLGTSANGLTQLAIAGQTLTVRLSLPLPAGAQLQVQVQSGGPQGQPVLVAQAQAAVAPKPVPIPLPQMPLLQMPLPQPHVAAPQQQGGSKPAAMPAPMPSVAAAPPALPQASAVSQPAGLPPSAGSLLPLQVPAASQPQTMAATPLPMPRGVAQAALPAATGAQPAVGAATTATTTAQPAAVAATPLARTGPEPALAARSQSPIAPAPNIPAVPAPLPGVGTGLAAQPRTQMQMQPVPLQANAMQTAVQANPAQAPAARAVPQPATPAAVAAPIAGRALPATVPAAPVLPAAAIAVEAKPAMPAPASAPATAPTSAGRTAQAAAPDAAASQPAKASAPAPAVAQPSPAARAPSGSTAEAILGQATQAAARQDSVAPLLQNLAALQGRTNVLPQPMAEAAMRLLAGRISLDRGPPGGTELKQAVLRSGIFLEAITKPGTMPSPQGDTKGTLLQLRALLGAWLGGEVAPVAPVTRRPPPPTRGAPPRGFKSEMPTLPETATPKEAGRALLGQTEAALSRVRLLQLASLPQDAARAAMPGGAAAEWNLELPLMLGHELALAQLQISRDGRGRGERGERGWRMRFSLNFSALGEVGAQVSLYGKSTSVAIWAEEAETAAALQEMLPELAPALASRGLEVGSVRVRQGRPKPVRQPSGQLMDSIR